MFRWDASETLHRITKPVLVLGGDLDLVTKLEASRVIAKDIPDARLQVVDGVNHMGFLERADSYDRAILEFATAARLPLQAATVRRQSEAPRHSAL